ncbi:hypothetical protein J6590_040497 [Homalodisca vitripennis]|nr:hypothetical protein J6590_040497 [Homalodisca vitripennis]
MEILPFNPATKAQHMMLSLDAWNLESCSSEEVQRIQLLQVPGVKSETESDTRRWDKRKTIMKWFHEHHGKRSGSHFLRTKVLTRCQTRKRPRYSNTRPHAHAVSVPPTSVVDYHAEPPRSLR